jgi:hypothetical protein
MEHPEGYAKALGAIIESVLSDVKSPYRFTDDLFPTAITRFSYEQMAKFLRVEEPFHQRLQEEKIAGTFLCNYSVESISYLMSYTSDWTKRILKSHHAVIYTTGISKGMALQLPDL